MDKQAKLKIVLSVFLTLVVLSTSIYVMMPDKIKVVVEKTRTKYYIYENESWVLGGIEYFYLFDGSSKMRAKNREINYETVGDITTITRIANYKDNITTIQTYTFNSAFKDVEYVPVEHKAICINCHGKIAHFEYRNILYKGITKKVTSPFSFGHNMKVEWENGSYFSKVYQQKYAPDKLIIKYKPKTNSEIYLIRMFDPVVKLEEGVLVGEKLVKELCKPVYKTWVEEIPIYKNCTSICPIENKSCAPIQYTCLNTIQKITHLNEKFDCKKTGKVNVSGKIYQGTKSFCKLIGTEICCAHNKEGGRYAAFWRTDGSVTKWCKDLVTGKGTFDNSLKVSKGEIINVK